MRTIFEGHLTSRTALQQCAPAQRPIRMGLFNLFMNYGKARMARRVLGRAAGGNVFMMMLVGYVGKRVLNHFMANRNKRLRAY